MARRLEARDPGFSAAFAKALVARGGAEPDVGGVVAEIIRAVRARGDAALLDYTERFDRLTLTADALRMDQVDIENARAACDPALLDALRQAADRIKAYHRHQLPEDVSYRDSAGVELGARWRPLASVGLYVPGGTAAYPSSVLINAMPARVAGVERLVMVTPTPDGAVNPQVLAAASVAGVDEIYRVGGAQAVAALAFGTATIAYS